MIDVWQTELEPALLHQGPRSPWPPEMLRVVSSPVPSRSVREAFAELADLSHRATPRALNERGIKTAEGKQWSAVQLMRVRRRLWGRE